MTTTMERNKALVLEAMTALFQPMIQTPSSGSTHRTIFNTTPAFRRDAMRWEGWWRRFRQRCSMSPG
jgi:hypothetical protein